MTEERVIKDRGVIRGNCIAIKSDDGRAMTYSDLFNRAETLKKILPTRSILFIICDNSIETLSFYFQVMYIKAVPLLLPSKIDEKKLQSLISIYQPEFIWDKKGKRNLLGESVLETGEYWVYKTGFGKIKLHDHLALLLMTSGSTGNSRIVRISYTNILSSIKAASGILPVESDDRYITTLPMNFTYGLVSIHVHWYKGATVLSTNDGIFTDRFWRFFEEEKATNFAGVSYIYKMLKAGGFLKRNYPHLRFVHQSGDKISSDLLELFIEKMPNVEFYVLYGQTEGTIFLCGHNCSKVKEPSVLQSVGKALSNWKIEIRNKNEVGIGEIFILGDTVSMGYADSLEDLALGDMNKGVLDTGDLGRVDREGHLYIEGRKSRFLKLMGIRINLDDIEAYVRNFQQDIECACTGQDDGLILYYTNNTEIRGLQSCIAQFIQINEKLVSVRYVKEIPKTPSGKVDYMMLNKL